MQEDKHAWNNSNLTLMDSELKMKIKEAAAANEPQWETVGDSEGLHLWRIEKFIVKPWPKERYGEFHKGDSYVILNTYKPNPLFEKLNHDIHIWIGDESSQDEYGTAAYKMVELDEKLGGIAVQHRETQGKESGLFLEYFDGKFTYLEGGIDSGFRHVEPTVEKPQLYQVKGNQKGDTLRLIQKPVRRDSMNSGDVFILAGNSESVWVWVGSQANKDERAKGAVVAQTFRKGKEKIVVLDEEANDMKEDDPKFWEYLPARTSLVEERFARKWSEKSLEIKTPPSAKALINMGYKRNIAIAEADENDAHEDGSLPVLFSITKSPNGEKESFTYEFVGEAKRVPVGPLKQKQPKLDRSLLQTEGVYIFDTGFHMYVWVGKKAERDIKTQICQHVNNYCRQKYRPTLPLSILKEGMETTAFNRYV